MFSDRMNRLGTETAFEVLARAKALEAKGKDVIHLEIGEPDFDTPEHIVEAGVKALRDGYTHYAPAQGLPVLRQAVAEYLTASRRVDFCPDDIVVTPGAKPILFFTILALVDPGDEVIYPDPGFPIYESVVNLVGGKTVPLRLSQENGFGIDVDELRQKVNDKTKLIVLNSPHNPTGGMLSRSDVEGIADIVRDRDLFVLSDEVYSQIVYDKEFHSLASVDGMKDKVILLDGFSKTYAMTGWRLGYAACRRDLCDKITKLMVNSNSCTASFVQVAGAEALRGSQDSVGDMVSEFRARRDVITSELNDMEGVSCVVPGGAFYVFADVTGTGVDFKVLADRLLNDAGVAVLAGTCFGRYGEGFVRFSYANSLENIKEALVRMRRVLGELMG